MCGGEAECEEEEGVQRACAGRTRVVSRLHDAPSPYIHSAITRVAERERVPPRHLDHKGTPLRAQGIHPTRALKPNHIAVLRGQGFLGMWHSRHFLGMVSALSA